MLETTRRAQRRKATTMDRWDAQLFLASANGDLKIVQELVSGGYANANARDKTAKTALHWAAVGGHLRTVQRLVEYGGLQVNARDREASTPLHLASFEGHLPVVTYLVESGALVDAMDGTGSTALLFACRRGHLSVVEFLIENSANINIFNYLGCSPTQEALENRHHDVSRFLRTTLNKDKRVPSRLELKEESPTPSRRACPAHSDTTEEYGSLGIEPLFLKDNGPGFAAHRSTDGLASLHLSCFREQKRKDFCAKSELSTSPKLGEATTRSNRDEECGASKGKRDLINTSDWVAPSCNVEPKHDPNARLLQASEFGDLDKVCAAIASGADAALAQNGYGLRPLHEASRNNHLEVVKFLLDHCADVSAKDIEGMTALHHASSNGNLGIVSILLENGASVEETDKIGATPLHYACQFNHLDCVKYLVKHGADVDKTDRYGLKPVQYIQSWGIVEFLMNPDSKRTMVTAYPQNLTWQDVS